MNQPWSERWKGTNTPTVGAGAVAEADTLRGLFSGDQGAFRRKVRIAVLAGVEGNDIPWDLYRVKRATVTTLTRKDIGGVAGLLGCAVGDPQQDAREEDSRFQDDDLLLLRFRDLPNPAIDEHRASYSEGCVSSNYSKVTHFNGSVDDPP